MDKSTSISILAVLAGLSFFPTRAQAGSPITEIPIPTARAVPTAITGGSDGNLWFCESGSNKIGRVTPGGTISEFSTGFPPLGIAAGPDGNIWYSAADLDNGSGAVVGRVTPAGEVTEFPVGLACGIAAGPDGNLWFTECSAATPEIGRITPAGSVTMFPFRGGAGRYASSITAGPDGNLWFTEPAAATIGRVSTDGSIVEFSLPSGSSPDPIVGGPDGNLWYSSNGKIGRITTSGEVTEFPVSGTALGVGPDGHLWFADSPTARVGRLAITSGTPVVDLEIPTGDASPFAISSGPEGNVWFTDTSGNAIGRIDLSAVCGVGAFCLGGRFEISAAWAGGGLSGTGTPISLTPGAAAFWFFGPSNLEVFVKILDNCRTSGKFNVYVNGLTHLGVTVTVTDKKTGTTKSFVHEDGTPFSLLFDDSTFACP